MYRLGGLNNRNVSSHCSGGQKSKVKVLAVLVSSEGCEEDMLHVFLSASCGFLAIFGVPWLVDTSPKSLPSCSHGVLPVCMSACTFYKDTNHIGLGAHPTPNMASS